MNTQPATGQAAAASDFGALVAGLVRLTAEAKLLAAMTERPEDARTWARYDQALRLLLADSRAIVAPDWETDR